MAVRERPEHVISQSDKEKVCMRLITIHKLLVRLLYLLLGISVTPGDVSYFHQNLVVPGVSI